jgi:hypothetical protein
MAPDQPTNQPNPKLLFQFLFSALVGMKEDRQTERKTGRKKALLIQTFLKQFLVKVRVGRG